MNLEELKREGEAPEWMTEMGLCTLEGGYLLPGETPRGMYQRVAHAAAQYTPLGTVEYWETCYFDVMWSNWLCPATPVLSNMGTTRGLPISCNSIHVDDSVDSIFAKSHELAMLSKHGAGVGIYMGDVRGRGAEIKGNGHSEGIIPWAKIYDTTTMSVSQGSTRRGASAIYLPVEHLDIEEFLNIRRPVGDVNRRCLNLHHGVSIPDAFMERALAGGQHERKLWQEILRARFETGEPYLLFRDNVNRANPSAYTRNGLSVKTSNICSEIMLHTDPEHSFVCCLSSLNLAKWAEWKNKPLPQVAARFLDAVLSEYIERGHGVKGLEPSIRSAVKGRAIGIGVLGWHTLLQSMGLPFDSMGAMMHNAKVFQTISRKAQTESETMAHELGEPLWCHGTGRRNTHLLAIAPTVSNSTISGGHSAGIEPISANVALLKTAKGNFIYRNATLETVLTDLGKNTPEVWASINREGGSVQHLDFMGAPAREVFLTARELNQHALVKQAAQRQQWIDQGQSLNLFFGANADPKYVHEVHLEAWRAGLKSLYYLRSEGVLRGDTASRSKDECKACEG